MSVSSHDRDPFALNRAPQVTLPGLFAAVACRNFTLPQSGSAWCILVSALRVSNTYGLLLSELRDQRNQSFEAVNGVYDRRTCSR